MNSLDKEKVFVFLDNLRESGLTNMFGAAPYVTKMYGLPMSTSRSLLMEWMETFDERHPRSK